MHDSSVSFSVKFAIIRTLSWPRVTVVVRLVAGSWAGVWGTAVGSGAWVEVGIAVGWAGVDVEVVGSWVDDSVGVVGVPVGLSLGVAGVEAGVGAVFVDV